MLLVDNEADEGQSNSKRPNIKSTIGLLRWI